MEEAQQEQEAPEPTPGDTLRELLATKAAAITAAAEWLDAHPDVATNPQIDGATMFIHAGKPDDFAARTRDLMDGAPVGSITKTADDKWQDVTRDFGAGIKIAAFISRAEVCEAVVVGTETVEIADPDAPKITVTRDVIEWKCAPILAGGGA